MSNLVIKNHTKTLVELPDVPPKTDKAGKVTREGYIAYRLLPGESDVPAAYWDLVKGNPGVKIFLAAGKISNAGEGKAQSILAGLDKLGGDAALKHVGKCENMEVLRGWRDGTESIGLRKLIDERMLEVVASQTGEPAAPASPTTEPVIPVVPATLS